MNKLSLLKLVSGEEVVAELYRDEQNSEAWLLVQPYTIIELPTQQGFGLVMRPFFRSVQPSMQEKISVEHKHIITQTDVPDALEKAYIQTRTGIDLSTGAANSIVRPS